MLCGDEAEAYFQNLDQPATRSSPPARPKRAKLVYRYVTWLVERRALDVYGGYKDALGASPIAGQLDGLLGEEASISPTSRPSFAAADPDFAARAPELEAVEASSTRPSSARWSDARATSPVTAAAS